MQNRRHLIRYFYNLFNDRIKQQRILSLSYYCSSAIVDSNDMFVQRVNSNTMNRISCPKDLGFRYFMDSEPKPLKNVADMTSQELNDQLLQLVNKNRFEDIENIVQDCYNTHKALNENTLKKVILYLSNIGKPQSVELIQKHCAKTDPNLFRRNGEFLHYLAKAHCIRGNSEKGLILLGNCYKKFVKLQCIYRLIFRELIYDCIMNRSQASLVIFKKYVFKFSEEFEDNYPLMCFWYVCWSSSWFSDQLLGNELLEMSTPLRGIFQDKAVAFSTSMLRGEYNEDAVIRLLQSLLKFNMMSEYAKVLQVLFDYKLKIGDARGCAEIIRNCETLGVQIPSNRQGQYIRMIIKGKPKIEHKTKDFKLKF